MTGDRVEVAATATVAPKISRRVIMVISLNLLLNPNLLLVFIGWMAGSRPIR